MRSLLIAILLCFTGLLQGQTYELGIFAGGSNYLGDVGVDDFFSVNSPAVGALAKWNIHPRYSYRLSLMYSRLEDDDANSSNSARQQRGYSFSNDILEASVGMEFNFVEFDLHQFDQPISPYIFGGVAVLMHDDLSYFAPGTPAIAAGRKSSFAIPMGLGVKGKIGQHWVLGAEVVARYALTDNLDGNNPSSPDPDAVIFGNIFSDDWYMFTGVTLTYTFVRKPCYSCFE